MAGRHNGHLVNRDGLPENFPTHRHAPDFWTELGRTVATFGFLEQTLGKAIFALTATQPHDSGDVSAAYEAWLPKLQRAVSDPLGGLIDTYGKALKDHPDPNFKNPQALLDDLPLDRPVEVQALAHAAGGLQDFVCGEVQFHGGQSATARVRAPMPPRDRLPPWQSA